ncbi:MAG: MFS transporter [Saprospiraceae bacterium]|nr:MFS transporter [Saprospiraceae bacterium]
MHPETAAAPPVATPLNDPRTINGWALFDWANSSYALVISSAIFPAYYTSVTDDMIQLGTTSISNSALYAYALSLSYILIAVLSPILSGIADASGRKKFFLKLFTTIGALSCLTLYFFRGMGQLDTGIIGFMGATIGFTGALVFYNAYLPEIATEDRFDKISAKGFAFGYVGSVLLLVLNLAVIMNYEALGIPSQGVATRLAFVSVGVWWLGFAQVTFLRLPKDRNGRFESQTLKNGFRELRKVWQQLTHLPNLKRFLFAFFFYSAGVQTVLYLAATFAEKELHFETTNLILLILVLQLVAIVGAYFFAFVSGKVGNKKALFIMLFIWILVCMTAYYTYSQSQFYVIAAFVGLVMGGIQALSRSTYSKLVPADTPDRTSYFSFYDILEKLAIVVGTFSWGAIEQLTGGMRPSILALILFFLVGMVLLSRVTIQHAQPEQLLVNP